MMSEPGNELIIWILYAHMKQNKTKKKREMSEKNQTTKNNITLLIVADHLFMHSNFRANKQSNVHTQAHTTRYFEHYAVA